ncbi:hypothetical protein U1Q18_046880, partial [Sarracenia purpurea var. burkii]
MNEREKSDIKSRTSFRLRSPIDLVRSGTRTRTRLRWKGVAQSSSIVSRLEAIIHKITEDAAVDGERSCGGNNTVDGGESPVKTEGAVKDDDDVADRGREGDRGTTGGGGRQG